MYYRGAAAAIVVYDITNKESFNGAKSWVKELQRRGDPNVVIALAGNKADLQDKRKVEIEEATMYAEENNILHMETSAKSATNVRHLFQEIGKCARARARPRPPPSPLASARRASRAPAIAHWPRSPRSPARSAHAAEEPAAAGARAVPHHPAQGPGEEALLRIVGDARADAWLRHRTSVFAVRLSALARFLRGVLIVAPGLGRGFVVDVAGAHSRGGRLTGTNAGTDRGYSGWCGDEAC